MRVDENLRRMYPEYGHPMRCQNGCGAVIDLCYGFRSYEMGENGFHKLICECCAAEIGHLDEHMEETPEEAPVCKRVAKSVWKRRPRHL